MPKILRKPAYLLHQPTGQARVRIDRKNRYLGTYGSSASREAYDELIAEWFARQDASRVALTIDDLALLYLEHADQYYRNSDGVPTRTAENIRAALRPLIRRHVRTRARDFGPKALNQVRDAMIAAGQPAAPAQIAPKTPRAA